MKFKVDFKIFLFILLFFITKQIETYATIMIFAIIHELGHLLAGLILKMKPEKIELMPYGLSISFKLNLEDFNKKINSGNIIEFKKIFVALAGPLTNLIIILILLNFRLTRFSVPVLVYSNILLILFNLLPMYPLDGGRIIKSVLHIIYGKKKSERYINNISFITVILLTLISSILVYITQNFALFLIILFLWCLYIKQDLIYRRRIKIYELIDKTIENN